MTITEQVQFDSPFLSDNAILTQLEDLGIDRETAGAALKGDADATVGVYEDLARNVGNLVRDLLAPDFKCASRLTNADLYDDPFREMELLLKLRRILRYCGVPDFTWQDLCEPNQKRLRRNLSTLINFARFSQWKAPIEDEAQSGVAAALHKTASLVDSEEEARRRYESALAKRKEEQQALDQVHERIAQIRARLAEKSDRFSKHAAAVDELAEKVEFAQQELAMATRMFQEVSKESQSLQDRLVEDPDKLAANVQAVRKKQEEMTALITSHEESENRQDALKKGVEKMAKQVTEALRYATTTCLQRLQQKAACERIEEEVEGQEGEVLAEQEALKTSIDRLQQERRLKLETLERDQGHIRNKLATARSELEAALKSKDMILAQLDVEESDKDELVEQISARSMDLESAQNAKEQRTRLLCENRAFAYNVMRHLTDQFQALVPPEQ